MYHFNTLVFSCVLIATVPSLAHLPGSDILSQAPRQRIDRQYHCNFPYQHDKGFFLSTSFGPGLNQAIQNPSASALRFGGQFGIGWIPIRNLALQVNFWGNYLKEASWWAVGPGLTYFLGNSNVGLGAKVGIGSVFGSAPNHKKFRETVLAAEISAGKYWWLSASNSLGVSWVFGFYGLTLSQGTFNSVGWNTGIRLEYIYN